MTPAEASTWARQLEEHLTGHLLPFWCGPALDLEQGGWMAWLSNDLKADRSQPRGLIVNSRILWTFSAAHLVHSNPLYSQMAERAYNVVTNRFWDGKHGGAFWQLTDNWQVLDPSKKTYGQAFCIYALSEYYRAFGAAKSLDLAKDLFHLIEQHAHDPRHGGYLEVCHRDWSDAGPEARLSEKDMTEKKSMNNQLHVLEAVTNLHRVWKDQRVKERLRGLIGLFEQYILDPQTQHLHHFFDEEWNVRSNTYTFGHDIEASWLLCEAADEVGDGSLRDRVRAMALRMAATTLKEGIDADGALCYEGKAGRIIDRRKECWPQAEALVGFINAHQRTGDSAHLTAASRVWDYIQRHLVDRVHGEWFWRINEDGQPDSTLPKVSEWKGPYHASRACLECARRLREPVFREDHL
jgi:mannobiose 2-epimerase